MELELITIDEAANACRFLGNSLQNRTFNMAGVIGTAAQAFAMISRGNVAAFRATHPESPARPLAVEDIAARALVYKNPGLLAALRTTQRLHYAELADNGERHQTAATKDLVMMLQSLMLQAVLVKLAMPEGVR